MDCDRVRELLSDYLEEALADGDRAAVSAHLGGCARCTAEAAGLSETIALLSALPREKAPPELLGRVMEDIRREAAGTPARGKPRFPHRVRIPIEAAAAIFLILLVYGIQRGMPVRPGPSPGGGERPQETSTPAPNVAPSLPAASPSPRIAAHGSRDVATGEELSGRLRGLAPSPVPAAEPGRAVVPAATARAKSRAARSEPAAAKAETREAPAEAGRVASAMNAAPAVPAAPIAPPAPALPGVTVLPAAATGVSPDEERIEPRIFAAPPSRMFKAVPNGREVTLEVASGEREGIEERIVATARRFGGGVHPGFALRTERAQVLLPGAVRVHLPRDSADGFLEALKGIGTIPPEGMPASVDLPAGPSPGIVAYTVRIRVR